MEAVTCRVYHGPHGDGPTNMAADEVLLRAALTRGPALRFYRWAEPTVSLGYFQPAAVRLSDPRLAALPWVRRPTGGATLVHHHELTYALALPPEYVGRSPSNWMLRVHRVIQAVLADIGIADVVAHHGEKQVHGDVLCFQQYTSGDLICRGKKVVGSAQRKYHQALLQHGSVLLRQSEHTPALPGLQDLTGTEVVWDRLADNLRWEVGQETGWKMQSQEWSPDDRVETAQLVSEKYGRAEWNEKR